MHPIRTFGRPALLVVLSLCFAAAAASAAQITNQIRVMHVENDVSFRQRVPGARWVPIRTGATLEPGDWLRTGPNSRVTLLWSDQSVARFDELTELQVRERHAPGAEPGLFIVKGILSFFHRGTPGRIRTVTRGAAAGIKGTEFVVAVEEATGRTTISLIDGVVEFTNDLGSLELTSGQAAVASPTEKPQPAPGFIARNILQWCFYYPGVLDDRELPLTADERRALESSLASYRAGDLLAALTNYPGGRQAVSEAERLYHAALVLSVGQVQQSEPVLNELRSTGSTRVQQLAGALRQLIAAVKGEVVTSTAKPELASELLAASYYEQSRALGDETLNRALQLARAATTNSPDFGFAWARVAELEFSFGRTRQALDALEKSLALSPRNAQALALKGFLLAAQNKPREAIASFDDAIAVDAALGNAWLGRGLCRIRRGDLDAGREDLLIAAAMEPQRSFLRSYLGKAYGDSNDPKRALHELELAKGLDDKDPTPWLYSALVKAEHNRINEAIGDLERSQELNDNRSVYRSSLSLDQDRSVRSANLARIYEDAGMTDWSVFEAGRAVSYDYANYSAHLFLANSYDQLRDPNRINLRYETPAEAEYLIANLLAPVGAGLLAQSVSQQEYSKLFERDRLGVASKTEYLSRGAWVEQGAQFGTYGNSSYLFEGLYRSDPGQRHNNDFEETELRLHLKHQLTPQDTLYFRIIDYESEGGDLVQYYDKTNAHLGLRFKEEQEPALTIGYHREWGPGSHTLLVLGRLPDTFSVNDSGQNTFLVGRVDETNGIFLAEGMTIRGHYRSTLEIYSAELQQIWQRPGHNLTAGVRYQWGDFRTENLQKDASFDVQVYFPPPPANAAAQLFTTDFDRLSLYGYYSWQIFEPLLFTAGVTYDHMTFPENFRSPPILDSEETFEQVSPKAGLIWTPRQNTVARFAYTRSLGGASLDQSFQIEPTQVGGFNQSFRSIIPESVGGANAGARFETFGLSLEQRLEKRTYLGVSGQILRSRVDRSVGVFRADEDDFAEPGAMREKIDYEEKSVAFSVNQLLGKEWSVGARYGFTYVDLEDRFPEIRNDAALIDGIRNDADLRATLHQVNLHAIYNHRSGFFARAEALWLKQHNGGYRFRDPNGPGEPINSAPELPGDEFWQGNVFLGYRFPRRKAEVTIGLLNVTDEDYKLNPLTLYNDLARERTFIARLRLSF